MAGITTYSGSLCIVRTEPRRTFDVVHSHEKRYKSLLSNEFKALLPSDLSKVNPSKYHN